MGSPDYCGLHRPQLRPAPAWWPTLTLDRDTINWFKAQTGEDGDTGGTKWMALAEKTLQEHARREAKV